MDILFEGLQRIFDDVGSGIGNCVVRGSFVEVVELKFVLIAVLVGWCKSIRDSWIIGDYCKLVEVVFSL